jgi:RHS repeat-associated protein
MLDTIPRYLFNAKPLDEESGLYDYGARSYDPNSGTFISRDKLVENFFWISGYAYCMNNPVKYIDPDGNVFTTTIKVKEQQENGKNKNVQYNVTFNGTTAEMKNVKTGEAKQYQSGTSKFVDNMVTAYNYIVNNGADVDGAMQQMAESHIEIKVIKTANTAEYSKGTIKMDFSKGSKVKRDDGESGYQSPALGFWGEVYHSYLDKIATKTKGTLTDKNDSYNTNEENYVHLNKESEVIDNLNGKGNSETKRGKYGDAWKTERMKDVTSTIPD